MAFRFFKKIKSNKISKVCIVDQFIKLEAKGYDQARIRGLKKKKLLFMIAYEMPMSCIEYKVLFR